MSSEKFAANQVVNREMAMTDLSASNSSLVKELYSADVFRVTTINKDADRNSSKFGKFLKEDDDAAQDESQKKETPHKSETDVTEPVPDQLNISESARKASAAVFQTSLDIKKENASEAPADLKQLSGGQAAGTGSTINIIA